MTFRREIGQVIVPDSERDLPAIDLSPSAGFVSYALTPRTLRHSADTIRSILKGQGKGRDSGADFASGPRSGPKGTADFWRGLTPYYEDDRLFDPTQIYFGSEEFFLEASCNLTFEHQLSLVDQDTTWHVQHDLPRVRTTVRLGLLTAQEYLALFAQHLETTGVALLSGEYNAIRTGNIRRNRDTNEIEEVGTINFFDSDHMYYVSSGNPSETREKLGIAPVYYATSRVHLLKI